MADRVKGVLKWFNSEKGFGFLKVDGQEKDIFLHVKELRASKINGTPADGTKFEFSVNDGPKGKFATALTATP